MPADDVELLLWKGRNALRVKYSVAQKTSLWLAERNRKASSSSQTPTIVLAFTPDRIDAERLAR